MLEIFKQLIEQLEASKVFRLTVCNSSYLGQESPTPEPQPTIGLRPTRNRAAQAVGEHAREAPFVRVAGTCSYAQNSTEHVQPFAQNHLPPLASPPNWKGWGPLI